MKLTAKDIISIFDLSPLPGEGGFYRETHRSSGVMATETLGDEYSGTRVYSTVIYYMVTPGDCSTMHRVTSDEIFCYHLGASAEMLLLYPCGKSEVIELGADVAGGAKPQVIVPGGTWMGCRIKDASEADFSLMSCIVSPGFEFEDFEKGDRDELIGKYPRAAELIKKLT